MESEFENDKPIILPTSESIKVSKNSRGYTWEVKIVKQDGETDDDWFNRLANMESKISERYGQED